MIQINSIIKDNDPRMGHRRLKIVDITATHIFAVRHLPGVFSSERRFRIKLSSVYTDGKPRRSGFSLERTTN